jgi:hypothetical protein
LTKQVSHLREAFAVGLRVDLEGMMMLFVDLRKGRQKKKLPA